MSNGGVIGADNRATSTAAPGVWNIQDVYNAQLTGDWPGLTISDPGLIEFVMSNAIGGIQGTVFEDVNFVHPVGNTEGRFTVNSGTDTFTITTSGQPPGHLLSVDDEVFFVEATAGDLPPPIVPNTPYYIESVPTTTTFKVSETIGGAAVSLISNGTENADRKIFKRPGASDPTIDIEIFHYDAGNFPSGLTITGDQQVGEDVHADFRLTCVVVDKDLTIDTGGTLRITGDKRRFGFLIASREDVQIGPGTWTIPNFENNQSPNPTTRGHSQFRRWQIDKTVPFANGYLVAGGNGGNSGAGRAGPGPPIDNGGPGGGGGSAIGGTAGTPNGNGTLGGAGPGGGPQGGAGGPGGGLPGNQNKMRNLGIVHGNDITIPGPAPTVRINTAGANGANGVNGNYTASGAGGGGGGGGGGSIYILHAGAYTNNGTVLVDGGTGGLGGPGPINSGFAGQPGGSGTIIVAPTPGVL